MDQQKMEIPKWAEEAWGQTLRTTHEIKRQTLMAGRDFQTQARIVSQDLKDQCIDCSESLQQTARETKQVVQLTMQDVYEDFQDAPSMEQKAKVAGSFAYKYRLAFIGVLFVASTLLSLIHDMATMPLYLNQSQRPRPFGTTDVVKLSIKHKEPSDIKAAVCFKTLFGDIDLGIVLQWAAYNRLLGFDHMFFFYRPEVMLLPRFAELASLPYVTLTENNGGTRKDYYDQWRTEKMCLYREEFAANYDWAMVADIDEYLWFPEQMGIKDFLHQHANMTYLSIGKQMYSLDHRTDEALLDYKVDTSQDGFAVSKYPFYMNHFCYHKFRKGDPICPTWRGRAKVIVRPNHHVKIDVHGNIAKPDPAAGTIHFHPKQVHFMEWPEIFVRHNATLRNEENFMIQSYDQVHIHDVKRAFKPVDEEGNYLVEHDANLQQWFDYVISRASDKTIR